ncbi:MAG: hypothetical protein J6X71_02700 [Bacteroidales bacterium]|nr:hypothetical protein [Bacteroidales bacterium]
MKKILSAFFFMLISGFAFAQMPKVTGSVWGLWHDDPHAVRLEAASVSQVGTLNGTTTDRNGIFSLQLVSQSGSICIHASCLGFIPQTLSVPPYNNLIIILEEDTEWLDPDDISDETELKE